MAPDIQRRVLSIWIIIVSLVALGGVIAVLAIGGRPDPSELRAAAPLLDGAWRFHIGDDPRWADANVDDSDWETMDLSAPASSHDGDVGLPNYVGGWMVHGHPGYQGYAWYRRTVTVPAGNRAWDVLGPTIVDDGYELYWNGVRLGGSGRLGASPRVVGTRPLIFALPADAAGTRAVLAIRAFMQQGNDANPDGGGVHVAPTLAPRPESYALYHVQWWRTVAGYIVEVIEPLAMFALIGLALAIRSRSSRPGFIAFACIALALSAVKRLDNAIVSWTDLMSLPTYAWLSKVVWMPLSVAAWTLTWNRWSVRSSRAIDGAILLLTLVGIVGALMQIAAMTHVFRLGLLVLFALIAVRVVRGGPMRGMAIATMAFILMAQYAGELGSIGVPTIWFPFGIGVTLTQYAYAVAIPLLALLIVRTQYKGFS
ncbi:glycoside hydrolase family 2 [Dyella koreensis]|uniref:Glycoside hydrolase family 2 n=2 Tax=Dyella koreensis TaxID=311235 RepID=A0ABW8K7P3_9GAMM